VNLCGGKGKRAEKGVCTRTLSFFPFLDLDWMGIHRFAAPNGGPGLRKEKRKVEAYAGAAKSLHRSRWYDFLAVTTINCH
jgi:hypothetical protein